MVNGKRKENGSLGCFKNKKTDSDPNNYINKTKWRKYTKQNIFFLSKVKNVNNE